MDSNYTIKKIFQYIMRNIYRLGLVKLNELTTNRIILTSWTFKYYSIPANAVCLQTILIYRNVILYSCPCLCVPVWIVSSKANWNKHWLWLSILLYNPGNIIPKNYIHHFKCILLSYRFGTLMWMNAHIDTQCKKIVRMDGLAWHIQRIDENGQNVDSICKPWHNIVYTQRKREKISASLYVDSTT